MPALTITAVDFTTDQITIPAHGLNTGDGAAAVYTALGTLPAPLAAATDYWAIRVDANTIKLATSSANALANTPINLTTNGSGTLLLLVGIPYRRARTYVASSVSVPGAQVKSVDLNAMMDALTAIWNGTGIGGPASFPAGLTSGAAIKFTTPITRTIPNQLCVEPAGATHSRALGLNIYAASANPIYWPIENLQPGDVISVSLDFAKNTNNGCTNTFDIVKFVAGVESSATGAPGSNNGNAIGAIAYVAGPATVVAAAMYYFKLTPGNSVTPAADRSFAPTLSLTRP